MKSSQANKIKSTKSCAHKVFWHVFLYLISIVIEGTRTKLPILFSSYRPGPLYIRPNLQKL